MRLGVIASLRDRATGRLAAWMEDAAVARLRARLHRCGRNVVIYAPVVVAGPEAVDIGDDSSIAPFVHIWGGGRVMIGARCMIGSHVAISSLTHDYRRDDMSRTIVARPVVIQDDVWIGAHAVILPGVTLGQGAVIGAGSVVTRDVEPHAIVSGVPARVRAHRPVGQRPAVAAPVAPTGAADASELLGQLNASPVDIGPVRDRRALRQGQIPLDGLFVGQGWHAVELFGGEVFRWVTNDAEVVVTEPTGGERQLRLEVEPGPGLGQQPFTLNVVDEHARQVASVPVAGREVVRLRLPLPRGNRTVFRLRTDGGGQPCRGDPRILNFRVLAFDWEKR
jgi:maltose O-acetyltransferase